MTRPLKIFTQYRHPVNAVCAYRTLQPLGILERMGKIEVLKDEMDPFMSDEIKCELIGTADICFTHAVPAAILFRHYKMMQDLPPRWNPALRVVDYTAPWVLDIDDTYDWVSPTNPAFATWGVRDMDGNLVGDGGKIGAVLQDGREEVLFEDGKPCPKGRGYGPGAIYNYRANINRIGRLKTAIQAMSCVTISTEILRDHVVAEDKPKRTEVFPNCMFRREFVDITPNVKSDKIRILWQGGGSHYDDWAATRDAMVEVTKQHPNIVWVVWGQDYTPLLRGGGVPEENIEQVEWVEYAAHKLKLATLGCDINIAIIQPNLFSRGKSNIKWYEASALYTPIPTLATNAPPYNTEIVDGVNGLLYDGPEGFVEKLGTLIENAKLRKELAQNAHEWVWENRDAEKWAPKLYDLFVELKDEKIKEQGDMRAIFGAEEGDLVAENQLMKFVENPNAVFI